MKTIKILVLFFFSFVFFACSSSEETTQNDESTSEPEIYIFDDVSEPEEIDSVETDTQPPPSVVESDNSIKYFVQVGAFTSEERANQFKSEHSSKTKYQLEISYSENVRLFVVRLPAFTTKEEAEKVRNEFWKSGLFNDAFIVTQ